MTTKQSLEEWAEALLFSDRAELTACVSENIRDIRREYRSNAAKYRPTGRLDSMGDMLRSYSLYPLLNREQEVAFSKMVHIGAAAQRLGLEKDTRFVKDARLAAKCKELLIICNMRLCVSVAKKVKAIGMSTQDLIQEGGIGLKRAAEKFDPRANIKFSTYSYHWINQGIRRALAEKSRVIRIPIHVHEKFGKVKKVSRQLGQEIGRPPTIEEIATEAEMGVSELLKLLDCMRFSVSADVLLKGSKDEDSNKAYLDTFADSHRIEDAIDIALIFEKLEDAIYSEASPLNRTEREVLSYLMEIKPVKKSGKKENRGSYKSSASVTTRDINATMGISKTAINHARQGITRKLFRDGLDAVI